MPDFNHISVADAAEKMTNGEATVCDIRDVNSYNAGHIADSFHLTDQSMGQLLEQVDFAKPLIVMCYHGHSSQGAAQYMANQGYEEVYSLDGGFEQWAKEQPTTTST
ncbi:MAG: thiosulfate sulfurtransferase [Alteromonadaceae bacterium]|jgi:thiosulfate sulfurtransferase